MDFNQFETRLALWPNVQFSAIRYKKYAMSWEIYAEDESELTQSRLFLCDVEHQALAEILTNQLSDWLTVINGKKRKA